MVLASCRFWTQAYTCFDSSQCWHVLRKRKRRELVAGIPCLPVVVSQQLTDWNADRAESHFQLWWKGARKTVRTRDVQCTVEPWLLEVWVLQAASLLALYVGALFLFSLDCHSCLSPHLTFDLFFILPSLCICLCAPLLLPAPTHSRSPCPALFLSLCLFLHIHPRALLAFAPALDKSYWAHPELLPHPHSSKLS